jgi:glycerol-3-phosphate acyltransferase PlsY
MSVLVLAYLVGSVPFSQIVARRSGPGDLRRVGNGTVSASGLRQVGVGPVVVAGMLDLAKGMIGPMLAGGRRNPSFATLAAAAAIAGHNWSPFLRMAGGRGISPAMGALLVLAPEGAGVLLAGVALGRAVDDNAGVGAIVADAALLPFLARTRGRAGALVAAAVLAPMLVKRLLGNRPAANARTYLWRLLFDRDERHELDQPRRAA